LARFRQLNALIQFGEDHIADRLAEEFLSEPCSACAARRRALAILRLAAPPAGRRSSIFSNCPSRNPAATGICLAFLVALSATQLLSGSQVFLVTY
jgi:hypothetical protein